MANIIKIKRSTTTNTPVSLAFGELGWSDEATGNGIGELFIGTNGGGVAKIGSDELLIDGDFSANGIMRRTAAGVYTTDATLDATTYIDGGNWKIFHTNGSGVLVELTNGASGTVLQSNGATAAPTWEVAAGNVAKVGTPVNNEMAVWTGDGTVEGAATAIYNDAAITTDQMTITANAALTSGSVLKVIGDLAALDGGHLVDLIVDNVGSTSAVLRLQQDGSGDIIQAFDGATEAFTVNQLGKIDFYGGAATTTAGQALVSDGTDMELRALTAADIGGTFDRATSALTGANVFSDIVVADGIVTGISTRALTASDIGGIDASGTPVNNQLAVWTDANTVEGEPLLLHDSAVTTGDQLQLTAAASITSGDVMAIISNDTGHTGNVLNLVQDEATTATADVLRLQQDGTGDMLTMFDGASEATTFNQLGKIDFYGGSATTTNRQALISDGTDIELRLLVEADISDLGSYATQLSGLSDVVSATNTNRFVLVANGTTGYVGRALVEADISDLGTYLTSVALDDITDVTITGSAANELLFTTGANTWVNYTLAEAGIVAVADTDASTFGFVIDEDDMSSNSATKVPTQQSVKAYVDANIEGFNVKDSVRVATAASLPAYTQGGAGVGATITMNAVGVVTIDGEDITAANSYAVGDRILVQGDGSAAAADEGIYEVTTLSAAGAALVLTRTVDADTTSKLLSAYVFVDEGTAYGDTSWLQTADIATVDTTAQAWSQFTSATEHTIANVGTGADVWRDRVGNVDSLRGILAVTNGGITAVVNSDNIDVSLDINGLVTDSTSTGSADFVPYYDTGEGAENKILIDDLLDGGTF